MTTRRQFLKAGLAGGAALAGLGAWYGVHRAGQDVGEAGFTQAETAMLTAIAAVVLRGALPQDNAARQAALARTIDGIGQAIAGLSAAAQKELGELFGLMDFPLTRGLLTGVWGSWESATPTQVEGFLRRWRYSRFELFQSAYAALHDLVLGAWYGQPESWAAVGYPGPPVVD